MERNGNGICLPTEHVKSAQELVQLVSVHSGSNWNLAVLIFEERGKPEYPEMNLSEQGENQQQTQPPYDAGTGNRARATLAGGECSHHCAIPAPHISSLGYLWINNFKQEPIQRRFDFSGVLYFGWPNQSSSGIMRVYIELLLCTYIYILNGCRHNTGKNVIKHGRQIQRAADIPPHTWHIVKDRLDWILKHGLDL